jgi:nucleotide-binding universal stress UspA family protein
MRGTTQGGPAVVVGTDGSASAVEAVRRAATLARARGADLHIVNGYQRLSRTEVKIAQARFARELGYAQMGSFEVDGIGDDHTIAMAILEDAAHEVSSPDLRVFLHAIAAEPHKALRWVADDKDAQLIVVGNKPARSLRHPLRRDVHVRLAPTTSRRVLVVDTSAWWHAPSRVSRPREAGFAAAEA